MMRKTVGIAAAALGLSVSVAASAEKSGWYMGLSGGKTHLDVRKRELDLSVEQFFIAEGAPVVEGSSRFDNGDAGWSIFAGYHLSRYFSVEAAYVDLGAWQYRSSGTVDPPGAIAAAPAAFDVDFDVDGFTLAGIGRLPLGALFDMHAGVGVFFADSEVRGAATIAGIYDSDRSSASTLEFVWSAGAAFNLNEQWSLSLDWRRYQDVGDRDETDEADLAAVNLAVIVRF
jgi:OOP family OmpA-OmpF porin